MWSAEKCPQRRPQSNAQVLAVCDVMWQRGIKVANQLTIRWEDYPGLSRWAQSNQKHLYKWKRGAAEREPERWQHGQRLSQTLLVLKMEDGDHEPRNVGGL